MRYQPFPSGSGQQRLTEHPCPEPLACSALCSKTIPTRWGYGSRISSNDIQGPSTTTRIASFVMCRSPCTENTNLHVSRITSHNFRLRDPLEHYKEKLSGPARRRVVAAICHWRRDGYGLHSPGITTSVLGALRREVSSRFSEFGLMIYGGRDRRHRTSCARFPTRWSSTAILWHARPTGSAATTTRLRMAFTLSAFFRNNSDGGWAAVQFVRDPLDRRNLSSENEVLTNAIQRPPTFVGSSFTQKGSPNRSVNEKT